MSTPLTISYTPGYVWSPGELLTIAKLNLSANPTLQLLGTVNATSIDDGAITPAKLNVSVAGAGLTGGGGVALAVAVDNITLDINAGLVEIKDNGISPRKLVMVPFGGSGTYSAGVPGFVPAPPVTSRTLYLGSDGSWDDIQTVIDARITSLAAGAAAIFTQFLNLS